MYASQSKTGKLFIAFSTEKQPYILHPIEAKDFNLDTSAVKAKLKIINDTPKDVLVKKILVVSSILSSRSDLDIHFQCDAVWEDYPEVGIVYTTGTSENVSELAPRCR